MTTRVKVKHKLLTTPPVDDDEDHKPKYSSKFSAEEKAEKVGRLSIDCPVSLKDEFKIAAIRYNSSMHELIVEFMRHFIRKEDTEFWSRKENKIPD